MDSNTNTADKLNLVLNAAGFVNVYGNIATGGGNFSITETTSVASQGIQVGGLITVNTGGGNLTLTGQGTVEGVHVGAGAQLLAGAGTLTIQGLATGTAGFTHGIYLAGDVAISQAGSVVINGRGANAGAGVFFQKSVHVESTGGTCSVSGTGTGRHGIFISSTTQNDPSTTAYFAGNTGLTVTGMGTEFGIFVPGHDAYTLLVDPFTSFPADFGSATFTSSNGPVTVTGNSTVSPGTTNGTGRHGFQVNGTCSVTGAGNVSLTGVSNEIGIMVLQGLTVTSSAGTATVNGSSTGRHGLQALTGCTVSGDQGVTVTGSATQYAILYGGGTGLSVTSAHGPISVNGTAVPGAVDLALETAKDPITGFPLMTHGEGKYGVSTNSMPLTVHGAGDVSVTASSTQFALDTNNLSVTSDNGKATVTATSVAGTTTTIKTDGSDTININGPMSIQGNGDSSLTVQGLDHILYTQGFSLVSTAGKATLMSTPTGGAGMAFQDQGPMTVSGAGDVNIQLSGARIPHYVGGDTMLTSTAGAVTYTVTSSDRQALQSQGNLTIKALNDINLTGTSTGQSLYVGSGLSLTSSAGAVTVLADSSSGTNDAMCFVTEQLTVMAKNDISLTAKSNWHGFTLIEGATLTSKSGGITVSGDTTASAGQSFGSNEFIGSTTMTANSDISITGKSKWFGNIFIGSTNITSNTGKVTIDGNASVAGGPNFEGTVFTNDATLQANGDVSLTGESGWFGVIVSGNASLTSTSGAVTVNGNANAASGNHYEGTVLCNSTTISAKNDVTVKGNAGWFGIIFSGTSNLTSTAGGITVNGDCNSGSGNHYVGTVFGDTTTQNAVNDISITGNGSWSGIVLPQTTMLTSTAGGVTINADGSLPGGLGRFGLATNSPLNGPAASLTVQANNDISITGKGGLYGIALPGANSLTSTAGKITLIGDGTANASNSGRYGIDVNALTAHAGGDVNLLGTGTEFGVNLWGASQSVTSANGSILINADATGVPANYPTYVDINTQTTMQDIPSGRHGFTSSLATISGKNGVSITGKATEVGMVLYGGATQVLAPNGIVTVNVDASFAIPPATAAQLAGTPANVPEGRHALATGFSYTLDGNLGVNITGKANIYGLGLQEGCTINSDSGLVTLNGTSTSAWGIFSNAEISGVGINATGTNLGGTDNVAGIDIDGGTVDSTSGLLYLSGGAAATGMDVCGVQLSGGTVTTSKAGGSISITGNSPGRGVNLTEFATIDAKGNNTTINGDSTGAVAAQAQGVRFEDGTETGATLTSGNGNIDITATSVAGDGIVVGTGGAVSALIDVGTGTLTMTADRITLTEAGTKPSVAGAGHARRSCARNR